MRLDSAELYRSRMKLQGQSRICDRKAGRFCTVLDSPAQSRALLVDFSDTGPSRSVLLNSVYQLCSQSSVRWNWQHRDPPRQIRQRQLRVFAVTAVCRQNSIRPKLHQQLAVRGTNSELIFGVNDGVSVRVRTCRRSRILKSGTKHTTVQRQTLLGIHNFAVN